MRLGELVETSLRVARERGRSAKIALVAELLGRLVPDEIAIGVAYLSGELPQGKIGIGGSALAAMRAVGASPEASLELVEVDRTFSAIGTTRGAGSQTLRAELLAELFRRATGAEQDFLTRLIFGELRQGAQEGIMAEALAKAKGVASSDVRRALMLSGDASAVAHALFTRGSAGLAEFRLELGRPLQPMLAQTAESSADAISRLGRAAFEFKLDGARVQVHRDGREVAVFSRQLNDVTSAVPEVVEAVLELPVSRIVLDGEVIAQKPDGKPHRFQTTMRRFGRRLEIEALRRELPLVSTYFDLLHLDGQDVVDLPGEERARTLAEAVPEALRVERIVASESAEVDAFLRRALAAGHEGVMAKSLDSTYEAGRRGAAWLKLKPAHTLDLVVLAVEWGSGRRKGMLSNLHLGARDAAGGGFVMLGKTFKGMTDVMLAWQTRRLLELETHREGHVVYVRPELVVEIAFDGVQASPHYPGGLALRFARVKRYRDDKPASEADTIDMVRTLFDPSLASA